MAIQYADKPKQPGETLVYSMEFEPGVSIATNDSLTGSPTVTVTRLSDGVNVTSDSAPGVTPVIVGMLASAAQRNGNVISAAIENGTSGYSYKITFTCDTTAGELDVEEDLVIEVQEL